MIDAAISRELAAIVRDHAEQAIEAVPEQRFLVLAEDCEELVAHLHAVARPEPLLAPGR